MMVGALVFVELTAGITEASTTRSASSPWLRRCAGLKWGKADQVIKPPPQRLTITLSYSRCPRRISNIPGMDGLQLLGEIKQRFPDLPVMMVTAYGDDARRRQATEYGADKCGPCPARRSRNKHGQRCALSGSQPRIPRSSPEPPQAAYPVTVSATASGSVPSRPSSVSTMPRSSAELG
jgi:CheY-like chemotaxis protein